MHLPISDYINSSLISKFATYFLFLIILPKAASLHAHSLPHPLVQMAFQALLVLLSAFFSQKKPIPWKNAPGCRLTVTLRATKELSYFLAVLLHTKLRPIFFCHPLAFLSCVITVLHFLISYKLLSFSTSLSLHLCLSECLQLFCFGAIPRTIRCINYLCIPVNPRCQWKFFYSLTHH